MSTIVSFKDVSLNFGGVKALTMYLLILRRVHYMQLLVLMVQVRLLFLIV